MCNVSSQAAVGRVRQGAESSFFLAGYKSRDVFEVSFLMPRGRFAFHSEHIIIFKRRVEG